MPGGPGRRKIVIKKSIVPPGVHYFFTCPQICALKRPNIDTTPFIAWFIEVVPAGKQHGDIVPGLSKAG
jgi:hypothetical protein